MSEQTFRPLNLGNVEDDDPTVIDSLVQQEANPPDARHLPIQLDREPRPRRIPPTRLIPSGYQVFDPLAADPWMRVMGPDSRRLFTHIRIGICTNATDGVIIADDKGAPAGRVYGSTTQQTTMDIPGHTGQLWIMAFGAAGVPVSWWAVASGEDAK
jgi:hypothetical protein